MNWVQVHDQRAHKFSWILPDQDGEMVRKRWKYLSLEKIKKKGTVIVVIALINLEECHMIGMEKEIR